MTTKIQFRRGTYANLPDLDDGEPGWVTDKGHFYIGQDGSSHLIGDSSLTVEFYGAVGDGTTDDADAIQNAINSGGVIRFGCKTYLISKGLTITSSNVSLRGMDWKKSIILASYTGDTPILTFGTDVHYCTVEDLYLCGDTTNYPNYGLRIDFGVGYVFNNLCIEKCKITALDFLTVWEATGNNIRILNCGEDGTSSTGIWNFSSSAITPGQCSQSNFSNIIMGSNYGCHFKLCNVYGNTALHFTNLVAETNTANAAGSDDNAFIDLDNNTSINFVNGTITINSKTTSVASGYFLKSANHSNRGIHLTNFHVGTNLDTNAALAALIKFDSLQGNIDLNNFVFDDDYEKLPDNKITETTIGGYGKIRFANGHFHINKTYDKLFDLIAYVEGNLTVEWFGVYLQYNIAQEGRRVFYASSTPAEYAGKGDICWRVDSTAAQSPGWVCTAAGTPGTWRAMANLA